MHRKELIRKYIEFFKSKGHKEIPNVSLIPENDPTVLFTTAGMHPLVNFLLGQEHPLGRRLCNVQKCIRTTDIEEVGDTYHHTFFEMLGNWSLGDYFKKEAIEMSFEFLTSKKWLGLNKNKIAISCFVGDKKESQIPKDTESSKVWQSMGVPKERIVFLGKKENWWGPAGKTGPCGPDTEMFYWVSKEKVPKEFDPDDEMWVEIWNDVFMQYNKTSEAKYKPLKQKNVDTGMGVERTLASLNNLDDNYKTEVFLPIIKKIEDLSGKKYNENLNIKKTMRIIADHIKAAAFIIADGVLPSNTEQGYVLRRLIRKVVVHGEKLRMKNFTIKIAEPVFKIYDNYSHLQKNKDKIMKELEKEEKKFKLTLEKGMNKFKKLVSKNKKIPGRDAFLLYQSYGFPIEMTKELAKENGVSVDENEFIEEKRKHQKLSRTATKGRFKSGLADHSEQTKKLHTSAHLLLAALREILKDKKIIQKGSNITSERLRLDFSFPRKLTGDEMEKVEKWVNKKIDEAIPVIKKEMSPQEAKKQGALGIFDEKYGNKVFVYEIGNFSKEICAGPHVKNTNELGKFKIIKQDSVGEGARRIKAILE